MYSTCIFLIYNIYKKKHLPLYKNKLRESFESKNNEKKKISNKQIYFNESVLNGFTFSNVIFLFCFPLSSPCVNVKQFFANKY